jgi:hypothetical protein
MSDASRHALYSVEESTYGVTPATPSFKKLRHTAVSLGMSKDITVSEELREDRQIKCAKHGVKSIAGDIGFEISYGSYDEELEAVLLGTWEVDGGGAGIDRLKGGVTRRSFSLMRHFSDQLAADKPYYIYTGVEYNTLNLTVAPVGTLTGSFGTIGQNMTVNQTEPAGSTLGATSANCPFNGFTGSVKIDGSIISIITELTLTLENGLEARNVVGSDLTEYPTIGRSTLTGSATMYFENADQVEKFINETESSLEFELNDGTNKYEFLIPRITYTGGANPDVSGAGAITLAVPFQALVDDTTVLSNIQIDRSAV